MPSEKRPRDEGYDECDKCDPFCLAKTNGVMYEMCSWCKKTKYTCTRCLNIVNMDHRNEYGCTTCTKCRTILTVPDILAISCESCGTERSLEWHYDNAYRCNYCFHMTEICKKCGAPSKHFVACSDSTLTCSQCGLQTRGVEMIHALPFAEAEQKTKYFGARDATHNKSDEGGSIVWRSQNDAYITNHYADPKRQIYKQLAMLMDTVSVFGRNIQVHETVRNLALGMSDPTIFDRIDVVVDDALKLLYMCDQLSGSCALIAVAAAITFANARFRTQGKGGIVSNSRFVMTDKDVINAAIEVDATITKKEQRNDYKKAILRLVKRLVILFPRISKPNLPLFSPNMIESFPLAGFQQDTIEARPVLEALRCMCTYLPAISDKMTNRDIFSSHVMAIYTMCSRFRVFRDDNDVFNNTFMCIHAAASTERYNLQVNTLSKRMCVLDSWRNVVYGNDNGRAAIVNCMSIIAFGNLEPRHATTITPALAAVAPIVRIARTNGEALAKKDPRIVSAAAAHLAIENIFKETAQGIYAFCFPAAAVQNKIELDLHKALKDCADITNLLQEELNFTCQLRLPAFPTADDLLQEARVYKA